MVSQFNCLFLLLITTILKGINALISLGAGNNRILAKLLIVLTAAFYILGFQISAFARSCSFSSKVCGALAKRQP